MIMKARAIKNSSKTVEAWLVYEKKPSHGVYTCYAVTRGHGTVTVETCAPPPILISELKPKQRRSVGSDNLAFNIASKIADQVIEDYAKAVGIELA